MAGRKQKNTVDYFPHFVQDSKTKSILKNKYGLEGYAVWFQLLEVLCKSDGHQFDFSDEMDYEWLLSELTTSKESFEQIAEFLVRAGKLDAECWKHKVLWCQNLVDNLDRVYSKRVTEIPRKPLFPAPKPQESPISGAGIAKTGPEITQSKVKDSKVEDSEDSSASAEGVPDRPTPPEKLNGPELVKYFGNLYTYYLELPYTASFEKEGALMKQLLKSRNGDMLDIIDWYLSVENTPKHYWTQNPRTIGNLRRFINEVVQHKAELG